MAVLTRVGAAAAEATTVTLPAHRFGDLIIICAFRDGSATNPTIPAGFTTLTNTLDGTLTSMSVGWKLATSSAETSGTWTNATTLVAVVYRGVLLAGPIGTPTANTGTTNTVNYAVRALAVSGQAGSSWFLAFANHASIDTTIESPPTGLALIPGSQITGALAEACAFDSNGPAAANWPSTNVSITGTAASWQTYIMEIKAAGIQFNNYLSPTVRGDGISVTMGRIR